ARRDQAGADSARLYRWIPRCVLGAARGIPGCRGTGGDLLVRASRLGGGTRAPARRSWNRSLARTPRQITRGQRLGPRLQAGGGPPLGPQEFCRLVSPMPLTPWPPVDCESRDAAQTSPAV